MSFVYNIRLNIINNIITKITMPFLIYQSPQNHYLFLILYTTPHHKIYFSVRPFYFDILQ